MRIKFLATGLAPEKYKISGEKITAYSEGKSRAYDLSDFPEGGIFESAEPVNEINALRDVQRVDGELRVCLCQASGEGVWCESDWIDSNDYKESATYVLGPDDSAGDVNV